jgi:LysM repeat protein
MTRDSARCALHYQKQIHYGEDAMKKLLFALILLGVIVGLAFPAPSTVSAAGPQWVVVNWGDTLYSIAVRYGTSVGVLMQANSLPNPSFVYAGQRLIIPAGGNALPASGARTLPNASTTTYYTVRAGDTLYSIASRFGTSVGALAQTNRLWNYSFIYTGQQLRIAGGTTAPAVNPPAPSSPPQPPTSPDTNTNAPVAGKWIDINIAKQTITAYEGSTPVKSVLVSTGIAVHPTPVGRYAIYSKYSAYTMSGGTRGVDYYYLPNVPWTMFFFKGYAIHGTYWHHNFGHPMSHGCVNLTIADAKWFYDWAPIGTPVITHY